MVRELLETVTRYLRERGVAGGRVYYGEPDPNRLAAAPPLVFVRLHSGPDPAEGTSDGLVLGETTLEGEPAVLVSRGLYQAELQIDCFAAPPSRGGAAQLLGLVDDVVPLIDGTVLEDATSAESIGPVGLYYGHGVSLAGTPEQNLKHALRVRAVFHRICVEEAWPADTVDVGLEEEG